MASLNTISPPQLMRLIGTPDAPVIVDVRDADDRADDPFVVPTSIIHDPRDFDALLPRLNGARSVILCKKGLKLSHGTAALLRDAGLASEALADGTEGWIKAAFPRIALADLPAQPSRWVTRHRPKIDRIACPWLIRRFIDPQARFLFVPPADVMDVADRFDAIPFDVEGVQFTHQGALCTLDALIGTFGLSTPALDRMATVVRAADTDTHGDSPQAAGLLALSVGLSRMYRDDTAQLNAGMGLYDALYRWARDGFEEGHDWPAPAQS